MNKLYREFFIQSFLKNWLLILLVVAALASAGCGILSPKTKSKVPVLLSVQDASKEQLFAQVNRLAEVKSIRGKVDVKFEDNTFAESGLAEKYKSADGQVIVQHPANINLRIQIPIVGTDIVSMTSDGDKFRVAVVCCVDKKYQRFVMGSNEGDYSRLQERVQEVGGGDVAKTISVFSSLRPQHFTAALIMQPIETGSDYSYTQSVIYQEEADPNGRNASARVIRGYYLLDELKRNGDNSFTITRRFWFDRVGGVRLARQQVFTEKNEILADIAYGAEQKFTENGNYSLPVEVQVTRPQERYSVRLTYQAPQAVVVGRQYEPDVFQLENKWQLPEVNLDKQQQSNRGALQQP